MAQFTVETLCESTRDLLSRDGSIFQNRVFETLEILARYSPSSEYYSTGYIECDFAGFSDDLDDIHYLVAKCGLDLGSATIVMCWLDTKAYWEFDDKPISYQYKMLNTIVALRAYKKPIGDSFPIMRHFASEDVTIEGVRYDEDDFRRLSNLINAINLRSYHSQLEAEESESDSYIFDETFTVKPRVKSLMVIAKSRVMDHHVRYAPESVRDYLRKC